MSECYNIEISDGKLVFGKRELGVPGCVIQGKLPEARDGLDAVCRMGDPDLLQCLVYRRENAPGGIFALRDKYGLLFKAVAESELVYSMALGHFGEMTANARYGVDVYENLEEPDD